MGLAGTFLRKRFYEVFWIIHVVLAITALCARKFLLTFGSFRWANVIRFSGSAHNADKFQRHFCYHRRWLDVVCRSLIAIDSLAVLWVQELLHANSTPRRSHKSCHEPTDKVSARLSCFSLYPSCPLFPGSSVLLIIK